MMLNIQDEWSRKMLKKMYSENSNVNSHELWAAAQLMPNEGIEDGVFRIENLLVRNKIEQITTEILRLRKIEEAARSFINCDNIEWSECDKLYDDLVELVNDN